MLLRVDMLNAKSCFVFTQLPSSREAVVCGRYAMEMTDQGNLGRFVYGQSYVERKDAVALDPINLPLSDREFRTTKIDGMFGALRDTAPDAWGRLVLERAQPSTQFSELAYLLTTSDTRVGALQYGIDPVAPPLNYTHALSLTRLEAAMDAADQLEGSVQGEAVDDIDDLMPLLSPSSGLGGARPKTTVLQADDQLWIAKFPSRGDRWSNAISEAAYLGLAQRCGIQTAETTILTYGKRRILLVKRFDQAPHEDGRPTRRQYLSAHTLLGLDENVVGRRGWSYLELAHLVRRISESPGADLEELFRRMVFNALVSNTDDHPRNHAVMGTASGGWRLSPAYDLVPSSDRSLEARRLAMACGDIPGHERFARRDNLLSGAHNFGLKPDQADRLITDQKNLILREWENEVRRHGGTAQDCDNIAHAICYEGFEYGS